MSIKTAVLERPRVREVRTGGRPDAEMQETGTEAEAAFDQEPGEEILQAFDAAATPDVAFPGVARPVEPPALPPRAALEMRTPTVSSLLGEDSDNPRNDESLQIWMSRARGAKLLTAREEIELAQRVQRGDKVAKDALTEANLRLVVSIAKKSVLSAR